MRILISLLTRVIKRGLFKLSFTSGTTGLRENLMVLSSLIKSDPLKQGTWIGAFHNEITGLLGTKYVFSFAAGRMALYAILEALDIGKDDEVILPGYTCVVVPAAIVLTGAKPVYVDISRKDYNIDVNKIEAKITPKTKAIIGQHTYGSPCDLDAIRNICDNNSLYMIEDCAHTMGTEYGGKKLGTIGDASFFSTDHTKYISTSTGGIAVTGNNSIGKRLRSVYAKTPFLNKGQILRILAQFIVVNLLYHPRFYFLGQALYYLYERAGLPFFMGNYEEIKRPDNYPYPARLSNIQAKIGVSQLKHLKQNIKHRRSIFSRYQQIFSDFAIKNTSPSPLRFVFEVTNREEWIKQLSPLLKVEKWFDSCTHGKYCNLSEIGYNFGSCPIAEKVTQRIINLPAHQKVSNQYVDQIAALLNNDLMQKIVTED
jgi:perosamine synthetase